MRQNKTGNRGWKPAPKKFRFCQGFRAAGYIAIIVGCPVLRPGTTVTIGASAMDDVTQGEEDKLAQMLFAVVAKYLQRV